MLKPKVVKLILEEMGITYNSPFSIDGETYPYRIKKDGGIERFKGIWIDSSYSYLDLIAIADANRIHRITENIIEQPCVRKRDGKQ